MHRTTKEFEGIVSNEPIHEQLRRQRMNWGADLDAVAASTNIQLGFLRAIEDGRMGELPPGIYRRNFIRSYLKAIGIENRDEVERIVSQLASPEGMPMVADVGPVDEPEDRRPRVTPIRLLGVLALSVGVVLLLHFLSKTEAGQESVRPVAQTAFEQPADTPRAPEPASPAPAAPAMPEVTQSATDGIPHLVAPAATEEVEQAETEVNARATEKVWLRVSPKSGPSKDHVLYGGESLDLELTEPTQLWIGNAGGLELRVDDHVVPLGSKGQVRKLTIDPDDLSSLPGA